MISLFIRRCRMWKERCVLNPMVSSYPWIVAGLLGACSVLGSSPMALAKELPHIVANAQAYFPDQSGNTWHYRGQMIEGGVAQIGQKRFTNISSVVGVKDIDGLKITVFHDTNPGNQGPADSYYYRDAAGIRYYGSKPGTTLEKQLVPYQIVRFPLEIPSSFQQLDRKDIGLGLDLDRDGEMERVDVQASVHILGKEQVTVPLGSYENAIRLEARMMMTVHLTDQPVIVHGSDVMTAWFVKGIGLVKYIERQVVPSFEGRVDQVIEVIEELEDATIHETRTSFHGGKATPKRVLTQNFRNHELLQIPFPARLHPYP